MLLAANDEGSVNHATSLTKFVRPVYEQCNGSPQIASRSKSAATQLFWKILAASARISSLG
jgi:hypothetical protein